MLAFAAPTDRRQELPSIGQRAMAHVRGPFAWDRVAERFMRALRQWESQRLVRVAAERRPAALPLSVIIPTKDRESTLDKTLAAYERQTIAREQYEILVVNDHGRPDTVAEVVQGHKRSLNVRLLDSREAPGPAAARNVAIEEAAGEIVLITGDDIVPDSHFAETHLSAHRRFPALECAVVGRTFWHKDLALTPFMEYVGDPGGPQFNYRHMHDGHSVCLFDRFYTSNVSLKRDFVSEDELLFSTDFRYAAYEDIEFACRLHLRGMDLRYCRVPIGYHLHAMDVETFARRQFTVGRMLTLLTLKQPACVLVNTRMFCAGWNCCAPTGKAAAVCRTICLMETRSRKL